MPRSAPAAGILFCSSSDSRPIKPACRSGRGRHSSIMIRFARQRDKNRERIVTCIQPEVARTGGATAEGTRGSPSRQWRREPKERRTASADIVIKTAIDRTVYREGPPPVRSACSPYRILQQSEGVTYSFFERLLQIPEDLLDFMTGPTH